MSKVKIAIGAIVGATAGFFAGILTAPKSGKETRDEVKATAADFKTNATEKVEKYSDDFNSVANSAKDKARQVVDDVKANAEDLKERTERAADGAKKGFFDKK